ncbi:hypothetical protein G6F49_010936 [Rhizopus delemar]|nr:hypothetical protein G6F49_010936 [Rhizopus delemar]KAG1631879.1 hypothetical protein G6F44_010884 [Rhizopus delemar]
MQVAYYLLTQELLTTLRHASKPSSTTVLYVFISLIHDLNQLNLEADESEMIVRYTTSTTNNEETAEGNIDKTEENDNTEQDEQCVDIVECKKRLREAYETILMYEVPLDDFDRKLHRRIRMRLAELIKSKEQTDLQSYFTKYTLLNRTPLNRAATPNIEVTNTTTATHNHVEDEFSIVCQSTSLPDNSDVNGSFLSDDYHPTRTYKHMYEYIPDWPDCEEEEELTIDDVNICQELKQFRATSSHLTATQGNIRDIRILSLYLIFPFMLSTNDSVTKYMPQSTRVLKLRVGWMEMKNKCNEIITDATKSKDTNDLIASFIFFELVPRLTKEVDANETGEDTFIKNYINCFFDNIFSVDNHFYQPWANIILINTNDSQYKPDWFAYVKPWIKKFKLATCEIKPPSKVGRGDISDFVKLGIEIRDMLDEILNIGVDDASVVGILIEGKQVSTYAMNTKSGVFRMIQLGEYNVIEKLSELGHFPALFTGLMQVKNIALDTARAIEKIEREHSLGKKREHVDKRKSAGSTPTLKKLRPNEDGRGRSSQLNDDELKELDESDSSQTIRELAKHMGASFMVLSLNSAKPPDNGDPPTINAHPPASPTSVLKKTTTVLYSKAHQRTAKTRESLIHSNANSTTSSVMGPDPADSNIPPPLIIEKVYCGVSQTPSSIFFDISSRKEVDRAIYKLAFYQFQDYVGLVVHKSGSNRYLEVNFDKDEFRTAACTHGLHFDDGRVIIHPTLACRPGSIIRRVTLQRLPWLHPQNLQEGLIRTLSNYGSIRDVGIVTDSETGAFLGSGYAVLDCSPDPSQPDPFLDLAHVIPWVDSETTSTTKNSIFIHAYWKEMPTCYKYCHELRHSASNCKQTPSNKRVCYYCFKPGHIRVQCPDKISPAKRLRGSTKKKPTIDLTEHNLSNSSTSDKISEQSVQANDQPVLEPLNIDESDASLQNTHTITTNINVNIDDLTELQNSDDSLEQLVVDMSDSTPLPDSQPKLKSTESSAAELDITMDDSFFLDDDDTTHSTWTTSNVDISTLNTVGELSQAQITTIPAIQKRLKKTKTPAIGVRESERLKRPPVILDL